MTIIEYRLSILVPGWNAEPYIENCIKSLLENDYQNLKIIIIAGGLDKSFEIALKLQKEYPNKIKALEQKMPHKNKALNLGLKEVDGDIIVITDVDCVYQKNWLSRINEIFQDKKFNVISGSFLPFQDRKNSLAEFNRIRHGTAIINNKHKEVIYGTKLCGANAAFRKEIFLEKLGKFEEISKTGDDKILGIQFNEYGEEIYFFRDIYVFTECYSNNLRKFIRRRIRWARDLFINPLEKKQVFKLLLSFGVALFKLFYPIATIIISYIFFNPSYIILLLLPWIVFYCIWLINFYLEIKRVSYKVNNLLKTNFNHKKAFKIVPLLFFVFGIITIVSLIYPRRHKW